MQLNPIKSAAAFILLLGVGACGTGGSSDEAASVEDTLEVLHNDAAMMKVDDKIFSIPSPVQTVLLIRDLKVPYERDLLLPADRSGQFASRNKQALALGVYGADMAYAAVHEDGQRALRLLRAIEGLSGELSISNALDSGLVNAFKTHINDQEDLLRLTGQAFRSMDRYLKNEERHGVSTGILVGGWVEGLYLAVGTSPAEKVPPQVATRLAEQGRTLGNLIELLERNDEGSELLAPMRELATALQKVKVEYEFVEPTLDAENKTTYINSATRAEISPETLAEIVSKVRSLRAIIIA